MIYDKVEILEGYLKAIRTQLGSVSEFKGFKLELGYLPADVGNAIGSIQIRNKSWNNKELLFKILVIPETDRIRFSIHWVENKELLNLVKKLQERLNLMLKEEVKISNENSIDDLEINGGNKKHNEFISIK
jgi:hypothetical protein